MVGEYVASPDHCKYGIVLSVYPSGNLEILWEGHAASYECLDRAAKFVQSSKVPEAAIAQLQRTLKFLLEASVHDWHSR